MDFAQAQEVQVQQSNDLFERLTLGVAKSLEKREGMCDVTLSRNEPAPRHAVVGWEQKSSCVLPEDLKNFYLTTNGLLLTWNVKLEDSTFPVGKMEVNSIERLTKLNVSVSTKQSTIMPSLADAECSSDENDNDEKQDHPHFDNRSRVFELENCISAGKVCLAYVRTAPGLPAHKPEIWFLDRSLQWHFLATDFTGYYRIMLMHLGLPQWQCAVTDVGLSLQAKQWFNMYAPVRLSLNLQDELKIMEAGEKNAHSTKIDFTKVFKGKLADKSKTSKQSSVGGTPRKRNTNFSSAASVKSSSSRTTTTGRLTKPWM